MKIELTTDSPVSRYGMPAVRIDGNDYGPADEVPVPMRDGRVTRIPAAVLVMQAARLELLNSDETKRFLSQWPVGPQWPQDCIPAWEHINFDTIERKAP